MAQDDEGTWRGQHEQGPSAVAPWQQVSLGNLGEDTGSRFPVPLEMGSELGGHRNQQDEQPRSHPSSR